MSMMGELKYFLGFQVQQLQDGTFLSQTKYTQDILSKFGMKDAKPIWSFTEELVVAIFVLITLLGAALSAREGGLVGLNLVTSIN